MAKKKLWLTYSWQDNDDRDVDYILQCLNEKLEVRFDRRDIAAGQRLWHQIAQGIQDPDKSDAWGFLVSQNSLDSEKCQEELEYALDRALESRGGAYPLIGIVYGSADPIVPAALNIRLCVSLQDADWVERVHKGVHGEGLGRIPGPPVEPFHLAIHTLGDGSLLVEMRPRVGTWSPFRFAMPKAESDQCFKKLWHGPRGGPEYAGPTHGGALWGFKSGSTDDGRYFVQEADNEATATQSYYIELSQLPSELIFGPTRGEKYRVVREDLSHP